MTEAIPTCPECHEYMIRIETSNYSEYAYQWTGEEWEQIEHDDGEVEVTYRYDNC